MKQYWECNNQTACETYEMKKKNTGHSVESGVQKIETSQTISWGGGEKTAVVLVLTSCSTEQAVHRNKTST